MTIQYTSFKMMLKNILKLHLTEKISIKLTLLGNACAYIVINVLKDFNCPFILHNTHAVEVVRKLHVSV